MYRIFLFLVFLCFYLPSIAQQVSINNDLEGYWSGAFIRNGNSVQLINVTFYVEKDTLYSSTEIEEWTYYKPTISMVKEEGSVVRFNTPYGEVALVRDSAYAEMVGDCNFANVHLKKALRPPVRKIEYLDKKFDLGDITSEAIITKQIRSSQ
jgi:hypothetical protein